MRKQRKKEIAYMIGFGLESGFDYWDIFFPQKERPIRPIEVGLGQWRRAIENTVKVRCAEFLSRG